MKSRILFVSHDASASGAPRVLLEVMRWLRANTDWKMEVLLVREGPRATEFHQLAQPFRLRKLATIHHLAARLRVKLQDAAKCRRWIKIVLPILEAMLSTLSAVVRAVFYLFTNRSRYDLIYSNTVANGPTLELLQHHRCPVITHIHELQHAIELIGANFAPVLKHSDFFIAASDTVCANLIDNHAVEVARVATIHASIAILEGEWETARACIRRELGVPDAALLVVGSGGFEWRKGSDLWLQAAIEARRNAPDSPLHWLWVGGNLQSMEAKALQAQIESADLADVVHLVGQQAKPLEYFAAGDVLVLSSREDPFPLACLEAAALGKPIVCFENAGGMPEFVEEDAGLVVPFGDVSALSAGVLRLQNEPELRAKLGKRAAQKVRERHTVEVTAPRILDTIQHCLARWH